MGANQFTEVLVYKHDKEVKVWATKSNLSL